MFLVKEPFNHGNYHVAFLKVGGDSRNFSNVLTVSTPLTINIIYTKRLSFP